MSDFFHSSVTEMQRIEILDAMCQAPQHTYMLLTKRAGKMVAWWEKMHGPPGNVWPGVTAENQATADERIPLLLKCRAAIKFVSVEAMLGPVDFGPIARYPSYELDWVILGPETGVKRRRCEPDWIRQAVKDCCDRRLPVFVKAFPINGRVSHNMAEWPEWARRRQFPTN